LAECPWSLFQGRTPESLRVSGQPGVSWSLGAFPSLLGVFLRRPHPGVSESLRTTPESTGVSGRSRVSWESFCVGRTPESLRVSGQSRSLLESPGVHRVSWESFLAAPRSLLESRGKIGLSLESPSVPRVSLECFPESSWSGRIIGREFFRPLCASCESTSRDSARAGDREGALPTSTKFSVLWLTNGPGLPNPQNPDSESAGDFGI